MILISPEGKPKIIGRDFKRVAIVETPANWKDGICTIQYKLCTSAACGWRVVQYRSGSGGKVLEQGIIDNVPGYAQLRNYQGTRMEYLPKGRILVALEIQSLSMTKCEVSDYVISVNQLVDEQPALQPMPQPTPEVQAPEPGYRRKLDLD